MTRGSLVVACFIMVAAGVRAAQTPQQPPPDPQQPPPVFRTGSSLVRVDVTVTNRRGEPVTSLTADDFDVEEDGVPQTVQTFKLISADGRPAEDDDTSLEIRSREHAAAEAARDEVRVFLIFWDEYHIDKFIPAIQGRQALTEFVSKAFGPTDLVALMYPLLPSDAIEFTRNRNDLLESIKKLEGRSRVYAPVRSVAEEAMMMRGGFVERLRSEVVVSALKGATYHLGSLKEGRKSIILISEGIPNLDPMDRWPLLQDLMNAANNNNVALYTVDPRGLTGFNSDTLMMLAENTGGQSFRTNAPGKVLQQVVKDASAFYLLGYASVRNPTDGKFHKIKVRVKRSGMDVRARQGYWAPSTSDIDRAARDAVSDPAPQVTTALSVLALARPDRLLDWWTGSARAADGSSQLTVAWSARPGAGTSASRGGTVVVNVDGEGGKQTLEAPVDAQRLVIKAAPGALRLHAFVRDAGGNTIDEDRRAVVVADFAAPLSLSSPVVLRIRNPSELKTIGAAADAVPYAGREFTRIDRLFVRFELHGRAATAAAVSARLLNRSGGALLTLKVDPSGVDDHRFLIDLPLASVARGDYLIAIEAVAGDDRTETLVPFRIVS